MRESRDNILDLRTGKDGRLRDSGTKKTQPNNENPVQNARVEPVWNRALRMLIKRMIRTKLILNLAWRSVGFRNAANETATNKITAINLAMEKRSKPTESILPFRLT